MADDPKTPRKERTPTDPTLSAMRQLDNMFQKLSTQELGFVLSWASKKHSGKNIKSLIQT